MGREFGVKLIEKELAYAVKKDAFIRLSLKMSLLKLEMIQLHSNQQYQNSFHSGSGFSGVLKGRRGVV